MGRGALEDETREELTAVLFEEREAEPLSYQARTRQVLARHYDPSEWAKYLPKLKERYVSTLLQWTAPGEKRKWRYYSSSKIEQLLDIVLDMTEHPQGNGHIYDLDEFDPHYVWDAADSEGEPEGIRLRGVYSFGRRKAGYVARQQGSTPLQQAYYQEQLSLRARAVAQVEAGEQNLIKGNFEVALLNEVGDPKRYALLRNVDGRIHIDYSHTRTGFKELLDTCLLGHAAFCGLFDLANIKGLDEIRVGWKLVARHPMGREAVTVEKNGR